jgi:hypothetical protein
MDMPLRTTIARAVRRDPRAAASRSRTIVGAGRAEQPRGLARVRGQDERPPSARQLAEPAREGIESVGIEDERDAARGGEAADDVLRRRFAPESGTQATLLLLPDRFEEPARDFRRESPTGAPPS